MQQLLPNFTTKKHKILSTRQVRYLLEQLQHTYSELKDENEIAIIQKYACYGKSYTIKLTREITSIDFYCMSPNKINCNKK